MTGSSSKHPHELQSKVTHTQTHTQTHTNTHRHKYTHCHTFVSLSLTHTLRHTHKRTHTNTPTLSLFLSLSHTDLGTQSSLQNLPKRVPPAMLNINTRKRNNGERESSKLWLSLQVSIMQLLCMLLKSVNY